MSSDRRRVPPPPKRGRGNVRSDQHAETQRAHNQMRSWSLGSGLTGLNRSPLPPAVHDTEHFKSEVREVGGYFLGRLGALLMLPFRLMRAIFRAASPGRSR